MGRKQAGVYRCWGNEMEPGRVRSHGGVSAGHGGEGDTRRRTLEACVVLESTMSFSIEAMATTEENVRQSDFGLEMMDADLHGGCHVSH